MKKAGVVIILLIMGVLVALVSTSLTNDTGTYAFDKMVSNGLEIREGDNFMGVTISKEYSKLVIKKDGTFYFSFAGDALSGTWEKTGNNIVLTATNGVALQISRNGLSITVRANDGRILTLKKSLFDIS
ncbi:MAG: hypothetical protein IJX06_00655 [Clostridia bacterium]|nr:hypothetical protein [Clostridia bacterium]